MIRAALRVRRTIATAAVFAYVSLVLAPAAHASGSSMPWEAPLQKILQSIEGPVAKIIAVIIIIATGLALAFGDTSGGFRKLIQIVFGLSIAFAASSFFLSFFSFGASVSIGPSEIAQKTRESPQIYRQAKIGLPEWRNSLLYQGHDA
ncbi:type IV secretion system protein VirB2 [Pseudorhizobium tarimense]|uniref:Type IV secretion system protein VirB2 n=1 Tax=Pseudorhizobium tarimense TaxID=1079109 RepID=A0ABV2H9V3_9HYPH